MSVVSLRIGLRSKISLSHIFTARIRSTREGNVCPSTCGRGRGGTPGLWSFPGWNHHSFWSKVPSGGGGILVRISTCPCQDQNRGTPLSCGQDQTKGDPLPLTPHTTDRIFCRWYTSCSHAGLSSCNWKSTSINPHGYQRGFTIWLVHNLLLLRYE